MWEWMGLHESMLWWLALASVITFVGSLVMIPILVVRIPADYFTRRHVPQSSWQGRHPAVRVMAHLVKNVIGMLFVLAGLAMLVAPGQGVLTIVVGITLLDFPGKRTLELKVVRYPAVHRSINWMRRKAHRPEILIDHEDFVDQASESPAGGSKNGKGPM